MAKGSKSRKGRSKEERYPNTKDLKHGKDPHTICPELIEDVAEWIGCCWQKWKIKAELYSICGKKLHPALVEAILSAAKKFLRSRLDDPNEDYICEAIEFYKRVIRDDDSSQRDRMVAQKNMTELRAVGSKYHDGGLPEEMAAKIREAMLEMDEELTEDEDEDESE